MKECRWPKGLKKTRQRMLVLEVLEQSDTPLTAQEISDRLQRNDTAVWLSTVYRVLDSFVEHEILSKTAVLEGGMALYEINDHSHRHYAVCMGCRRMIPMESCPLEALHPVLAEQDFQVLGHRLQMYGLCAGCRGGAHGVGALAGME